MKTVFLTGASGFLGKYLVRGLQAKGHKVVALIRPESRTKVEHDETYGGVTWIEGELETLTETLTEAARKKLEPVTDILHSAAIYDLALPESSLYGANVIGTHEMIRLARALPNLEAFHHISTLAVAGNLPCKSPHAQLDEEQFDIGQVLPDGYSATKFAAEGVLRHSAAPYAKKIYRLGILVGDSQTGYMPKTDGLYYILRFLLEREGLVRNVVGRLKILPFPFAENAQTYLIAVDVAAAAILAAFDGPVEKSVPVRTYHIVGEGQPVKSIIASMMNFLGLELKLVPMPESKLNDLVERVGVPKEALAYLYRSPKISNQRFAHEFPDVAMPKFEDYADTLYRYARENWAKSASKGDRP